MPIWKIYVGINLGWIYFYFWFNIFSCYTFAQYLLWETICLKYFPHLSQAVFSFSILLLFIVLLPKGLPRFFLGPSVESFFSKSLNFSLLDFSVLFSLSMLFSSINNSSFSDSSELLIIWSMSEFSIESSGRWTFPARFLGKLHIFQM